ncbi:Crotonobetainyl-CoA:carnitine CoA-transferase CaiB [Cryptosporangium aurantiacum]|uniref:Crotonobetainyl-CoA:carnitine CoA-transferase CaiB n=2 Tax=Cryptosporangium aurantiacum TaxID=134849 RepID=A0A1M7RNZ1_9ACTN|nr:Crotonobetainyl-CoA:carnitine CoA-transferase CaiB [Cryptosporangium aurantiacum]
MPLAGLRVIDLGIITAGAASSQVLADFGAEVIKVESTTYTDPFRSWSQVAGAGSIDPDASPAFNAVNRGKLGVAINLKTDEGRAAFLRLVAQADLVVENFRRGVLERLGVGFEQLKAANPRIVLLSLSSQGSTGPERDYISFGSTLEAIGGLMSVTGYGPDLPMWTGNNVNYPDQLVSIVAPGLALAALRLRDRTNEAVHVDHSQREAVTSLLGHEIVRASRDDLPSGSDSNRHPRHAPHGVYRTAGEDDWLALSVRSDDEWSGLCEVLGLDAVARDPRFATADARAHNRAELDDLVGGACASRAKDALARELQAAGVPAAPVQRPDEVLDDPQLASLGFYQTVPGDSLIQRGFIARLSRTPAQVRRRAPRLGEHTDDVLALPAASQPGIAGVRFPDQVGQ